MLSTHIIFGLHGSGMNFSYVLIILVLIIIVIVICIHTYLCMNVVYIVTCRKCKFVYNNCYKHYTCLNIQVNLTFK